MIIPRSTNIIALGIMFGVIGWSGSAGVMAEEQIESEGTRIIGDSDMPKALYIVPWKKPALPALSSHSLMPYLSDALLPVTRESLMKEIKYHELFQLENLSKPGE